MGAVKIVNNKEQVFCKLQINANPQALLAFFCGTDCQCFALTNSYGFDFLLSKQPGFYCTTGTKNRVKNK